MRARLFLLAPILAAAIALVFAGARAQADGFGGAAPAPGTGYAATSATVDGGTYAIRTSDAIVRFNSTDAGAPTASLPSPSYISERHLAVWSGWTAAQVAPIVSAGDAGVLILIADAGFVDAATIAPVGASVSFTWTGSEWAVSQ